MPSEVQFDAGSLRRLMRRKYEIATRKVERFDYEHNSSSSPLLATIPEVE
jgi:hypothetical protein